MPSKGSRGDGERLRADRGLVVCGEIRCCLTIWPEFPIKRQGRTTSVCSKRLSSKAAASEEVRRTLRYVEPLSDARTTLAGFFSILSVGIEVHGIADIKNSAGGE